MGVGYLLSHHLIQIGAIAGLFPSKLLLCAMICPGTKTYRYIRDEFQLFNNSPGSASSLCDADDSVNLLSAVSHCLGVSVAVAENITCKAVQHSLETESRYCDILYREQTVFSVVAGKHLRPFFALHGIAAHDRSRTPVLLRWNLNGELLPFTVPIFRRLTLVHDSLPQFMKIGALSDPKTVRDVVFSTELPGRSIRKKRPLKTATVRIAKRQKVYAPRTLPCITQEQIIRLDSSFRHEFHLPSTLASIFGVSGNSMSYTNTDYVIPQKCTVRDGKHSTDWWC